MNRSNITFNHKYRFSATAAQVHEVTVGGILGAMGAVGTVVNTTVSCISAGFKINEVQVWAPPASQGASATASIEWAASTNGPPVEVSDTTVSVSTSLYVHSKPPRGSQASFWQNLSNPTGMLFTLNLPAGSIIDVSLTSILNDDDTNVLGTNFTIAVSTAALGKMYYLALDSDTGHNLVPVSLTTTF